MVTLGFFTAYKTTYSKSVLTCPMPVARAAPSIPIFGNGPMPNIKSGSSMIFTIQPVISPAMEAFILPTAWKIFSYARLIIITIENEKTIVE